MNTSLIVICATVVIFLVIICVTVLISDWVEKLCKHEWELIEKVRVDTHGFNDFDRIYLRCKKCGKVKCKDMR